MNGLLFLFSCTCALSCGADSNIWDETTLPTGSSASPSPFTNAAGDTFGTSVSSGAPSTTPSPGPERIDTTAVTTTYKWMTYRKECLPLYFVSGGLIILCIILLLCTVMLVWKVWQLGTRLKSLGSNGDLISNSEYWLGTARKNKGKEAGEAKENAMLLECRQTQEDVGDAAATGQANEGEQRGEEKKEEEEKVTPVTAAGNSSSTKPQEDKTDTRTGNAAAAAAAAASSEGTEEPKDGV